MAWTWTEQAFYGGGGGRRLSFAIFIGFLHLPFLMYIFSAKFSPGDLAKGASSSFFLSVFSRGKVATALSFGGLAAGLLFGIWDRSRAQTRNTCLVLRRGWAGGRDNKVKGVVVGGGRRTMAATSSSGLGSRVRGVGMMRCLLPLWQHYVWGREIKGDDDDYPLPRCYFDVMGVVLGWVRPNQEGCDSRS